MATTTEHIACWLLIALPAAFAMQLHSHHGAGACECLDWKAAYQQIGSCGHGLEFVLGSQLLNTPDSKGHWTNEDLGGIGRSYAHNVSEYQLMFNKDPHMHQRLAGEVSEEFCGGFFQKLTGSQCVKVAIANAPQVWYGQSWCYVSSSCQALNGGEELLEPQATGLSMKLCQAGEDKMLGDSSPMELMSYLEGLHYPQQDVVLPAKMAWPYMGEDFRWIAGFWHLDCTYLPALCNSGSASDGYPLTISTFPPVSSETKKELQAIVDSGKTVVWNFYDHGSDAIVVKGKELWHLADNGAVCLQGCMVLSPALSSYLPRLAVSDAGNDARGLPVPNFAPFKMCHYLLSGSQCDPEHGSWP